MRLAGKIDRVGLAGTNLTVDDPAGKAKILEPVAARSHAIAVDFLLDWLSSQPAFASVKAAGHRIVQGMKHSEPERITPKLLAELHRLEELSRLDPVALKGGSFSRILAAAPVWPPSAMGRVSIPAWDSPRRRGL